MSLRIWLPLNGSLENKGLDDVTVTNNGATIDNNGKIGKCYSFDGSTSGINIIGDTITSLSLGNFSIAFWIYNNDQGDRSIYLATIPSTDFGLGIEKTVNEGLRIYWQGNPDYYPNNFKIPVQEWCHVTVVIKNNNCYCYKNGTLFTSREDGAFSPNKITKVWEYIMLGRDKRTGNTVYKGKLNDVRIYDHALSPLEVKHIAQGLILHYPLNRNGWGQENLIANSNVEKSGKGGLILYDLTTTGINTVLGKTMRISADIKSDMINSILDCYVRSSSFQSMCSNTIFTNIGTDYKRYSMTTICNTNQSLTPQWFAFRSNGSNGTTSTATFTIKNVKLEIGENTTPWSPASSDVLATTMGLNDNVEYDCSGYCNNGTRTGTFSWTGDTPRYNVSTSFDGSAKIERDSLLGEVYTLSCWAKTIKNKSTSQMMVVDSNSQMSIAFYNGTIIGVYGTTRSTGSKCTLSGSNYKENEWNHFVVVKTSNDGKRNIYCNGELLTPSSNDYWSSAPNHFGIGARSTSTPLYFYGEISDVRAYATALSADDVKSLYQNSAYIDNQGNIYGAVYEEV